MNIRKYRPEDLEDKKKAHRKAIREIASKDYSEDEIDAWTSFDDYGSIDNDVVEGWVAIADGELVGFADYRKDEGSVINVYVDPDYLRRGIGSRLLEKVLQDARNKGLDKLTAEASVTAKEFYQSHGFEVVEETVHKTNGEELQAFKMRKSLD